MKMIEEVNEIRDFLNHPSINLTAVGSSSRTEATQRAAEVGV